MGISSANSHETSLVHLGEPSGLNSLLHMLNATVIPTKVSYVSRFVFFSFARGRAKGRCGGIY